MNKNWSVYIDILIFFAVIWAVKLLEDNYVKMIGSGVGLLLLITGVIRLYVYIKKTKFSFFGFSLKFVIALIVSAFSEIFWSHLFYMKLYNVIPWGVDVDDIEFLWTVNTAIYVFLLLAIADRKIELAESKQI